MVMHVREHPGVPPISGGGLLREGLRSSAYLVNCQRRSALHLEPIHGESLGDVRSLIDGLPNAIPFDAFGVPLLDEVAWGGYKVGAANVRKGFGGSLLDQLEHGEPPLFELAVLGPLHLELGDGLDLDRNGAQDNMYWTIVGLQLVLDVLFNGSHPHNSI